MDPSHIYSPLSKRTNPEAGAQFLADSGTRALSGIVLATVHFYTGTIQPSDTNASTLGFLAKVYRWLEFVKAETPIHSDLTLPSAILEVLFARSKHAIHPGLAQLETGITEQAFITSFHRWYRIVSDYRQPDWRRHGACSTLPSEMIGRLGHDKDASQFVRLLCEKLARKRGLFFSRDGYMGCGPPHMAEGDKLTILRGVAVPMILREESREQDAEGESLVRYRLIGPASIHGLMSADERNRCLASRAWTSISLV